ncbi:hypothetical protein GCM10010156_03830 [Planobispora rosea]|uniref:Uncharacterized protein n=1 Tax=Planobispora rosea TaxID=35762 RepID=A0A8J3RZ31_PLARO|nr:hypothetical protein GCM10010156_03830 [Planobispora rosea]GIH82104.1 hypothetical protein Pro02_05120 [Planobispora rosea]
MTYPTARPAQNITRYISTSTGVLKPDPTHGSRFLSALSQVFGSDLPRRFRCDTDSRSALIYSCAAGSGEKSPVRRGAHDPA